MIAWYLIAGISSSFPYHSVVGIRFWSILSGIATAYFHNRVLFDPPRACYRFKLLIAMKFQCVKSKFAVDLKHVVHFLHKVLLASHEKHV